MGEILDTDYFVIPFYLFSGIDRLICKTMYKWRVMLPVLLLV
jgi:hypothetical protein